MPTAYQENRQLHGVEAVVDKDFASELLARALEADLLLLATDVDAVCINWGRPDVQRIWSANPAALRQYEFAEGSIGPKVEAACKFAEFAGRTSAIGALRELPEIFAGSAGTRVSLAEQGMEFYPPMP